MTESALLDRAAMGWRPKAETGRPFARVDVYGDTDPAVLEAWATLEAEAPCSIYQTRAWVLPWLATIGRKAGLRPAFVVARSREGRPLLLLGLGLASVGPARIATFLGGRDSNFNLALVRPGVAWSAPDLLALLRAAGRALGAAAPDGYRLVNQPLAWAGAANPFAALRHQPSPSAAYGAELASPAERFFDATLSKDTRKKLRKKEARLATLGPVTHRIAADAAERAATLDAFFAQKLARFREQAVSSDFDDPRMRAFIEAAAAPGRAGTGIELHALLSGSRIVAVYGGASHGGHWSGMFNAFDPDPDIARTSPGDLLLMRVIATACAAGATHFDLGIGEARYKATFCAETIPLFDCFVPLTARGWLLLKAEALALRAKRMVKRNPRAFALLKRLRALSLRRSGARPG